MTASGRAAAVVCIGFLYALTGAATPEPAFAVANEPPATMAPAAVQSEAVREAQRLLADLGQWQAAPDGIADEAFRRALADFQRQVGQDPTGQLDDKTLRSLRTRSEAARTVRKLDAARAAEVAEARAAIAADATLAARLAPQPEDARADAGRDIDSCRNVPTAPCLLAEARETAKGIVDPELRDWVLADIAAALALAEGPEAVWPVLRMAADPRSVFTGLRRAAVAQAAAGHEDGAFATAAAMKALPREALRTWSEVAQALSQRRPVPETTVRKAEAAAEALLPQVAASGAALVTLARAAEARGAADLAQERLARAEEAAADPTLLVAAWAEVGRPDRAAAGLAAMPADADRTPVLVELAAAQARAGAADAAQEAARAVPEPRYRAVALAEVGALLEAPALVREAEAVAAEVELPFAAAYAWARIAEAWRRLGETPAALAAARRIGDDALRVEALQALAVIDPALDAEAEEVRTAMLDRVARVRLAGQRAERLAAAGAPEAGAAVRATVDDALAVRNPWNRARVLVTAARAVAAAQDHGVAVPDGGGNR